MNTPTIIILCIIAAALLGVIIYMVTHKNKVLSCPGCSGDCSKCTLGECKRK